MKMCSLDSMKTSFQLFLRYMPFSISNALFRICSYAFILGKYIVNSINNNMFESCRWCSSQQYCLYTAKM